MANRDAPYPPFAYSLFASLLLLAGDGFGRTLARTRIGVGPLTAHRQTATMTQAAIAAEVHQTLDVDADFATQVALDEIVAVDDFADLEHFSVAELIDATILGDLHLFEDLTSDLLADAMDVLERDQHALVGRNVHAGNTGHGLLLLPIPRQESVFKCLCSRAGVHKREHDAHPWSSWGPASFETIRLGCGAY